MVRTRWIATMVTAAALAVGGCSGAAASTAPDRPADASQPAASADAADPSSAAASPAEAAGGAGEACELVTPEEAAGVLGIGDLTPDPLDGDPSYCTYTDASGGPFLALSLAKESGQSSYDLWKGATGVVEIDGLGDGAIWDPSTETVFVYKNGRFAGITAGQGSSGGDQRQEWAKAIAAFAVSRM